MNKRLTFLVFPLLFLLLLLDACGAGSGNAGQVTASKAATQTPTVKLHSGGGCFFRLGETNSDGDYDHSTHVHTSANTKKNAPYLDALFDSCTDVISLNVQLPSTYQNAVDYYQIRWAYPGLTEQQFSTDPEKANLFSGAHFDTVYSFIVQGCERIRALSICDAWSDPLYVATYAPGACHPGYVWRNAKNGDAVCVTPQTRDQTAYDNSQRKNRRDPKGAYGPNSCKQGYVWRNAFNGDVVCVTPATRDQAADDNSQDFQRRYPPS